MKYHLPEDIYVVKNRKSKKHKIIEIWSNRIINPNHLTLYEVALKFLPCRSDLRFYKVYGDILFAGEL